MKPAFAFFLITLSCAALHSSGQEARSNAELRFAPVFAGSPLILGGEEGGAASSDGTRISLFRFYVSAVSLWQDGQEVWSEPQSCHLLDASEPSSLLLPLSATSGIHYNSVRFTLGIDSATNAAGAGGGVLDATKGMYWAWHSGYINLKLEGTSPKCTTRKNAFQFHLGGFQNGALCAQEVVLPLSSDAVSYVGASGVAQSAEHTILVDVDAMLSQIDLATRAMIMTPGEEAVKLSRTAAKMFRTATTP